MIRISQIADDAEALGSSLSALCKLCNLSHATVSRWRNGRATPRVSDWEIARGKLERALDRERKRLARALEKQAGKLETVEGDAARV